MLVFYKQKLAYFAVPKTGTQALTGALRKHADIAFGKRYKHMTVGKFHKGIAPALESSFKLRPERFAVMREPLDQLRSWYNFRKRDKIRNSVHSTLGISFDEFVLDVISNKPLVGQGVGSQFKCLSTRSGKVPVHHLFAYESPTLLLDFLEERFETEITLQARNVSPKGDAELSSEVEAKLRAARSRDFDLYARIQDAGGILRDYSED